VLGMSMARKVKTALVITPLIIAGFVVGLTLLGFEVGRKCDCAAWPFVLSTVGLAISILVSYKFLKWWLKQKG